MAEYEGLPHSRPDHAEAVNNDIVDAAIIVFDIIAKKFFMKEKAGIISFASFDSLWKLYFDYDERTAIMAAFCQAGLLRYQANCGWIVLQRPVHEV